MAWAEGSLKTCSHSPFKRLPENEGHRNVPTGLCAARSSLPRLPVSFCTVTRTIGSHNFHSKGLTNWHPAYHPACHSSKERLAGLLSTFTIRGTMSSLTLHLHSPSSLPKCCWILPAPRGFQNPYLWIPNRSRLLRNPKDETKASLLECVTLGRLSERKKRGAATQGQDSRAESSLTIPDAMKEKNAVLCCEEMSMGFGLD